MPKTIDYVGKERRRPSPGAEDMQAAQRLWEVSEAWCREGAAGKAER